MKLVLKLLKQDLKYQICKKWYYFVFVILLVIYMCIQADGSMKLEEETGIDLGFGRYLSYVFQGTIEYIRDIHPFEVRPDFMLIHIIWAYMIAWYPVRDLQTRGYQIFIRTEKVRYWWYEKCIWTAITMILYYLIIFLTILVYGRNIRIESGDILYLMFLPCITSFMLALLKILISLILAPVYGFMTIVFLMLLSTFFFSKFLPGNFLMVNRMIIVREGGVTFGMSVSICMVVIAVCFAMGSFYIKKKDILS